MPVDFPRLNIPGLDIPGLNAREKRLGITTVDGPLYSDILAEAPAGELVALHVDATCYDPDKAQPVRMAALRVSGYRILTSQGLLLDQDDLADSKVAADRLIRFIGGRPLVGFYLEFAVALLNRLMLPVIGGPLANECIEVSGLYYDTRGHGVPGKSVVDLRLSSILTELGLPGRAGDASENALASAMIYLRLRPPVQAV